MDLAHDAQRSDVAQCENVGVRPFQRGPIIEHQQHTGNRFHKEEEEGNSSHAPGVAERNALLLNRNRVKVQKEVCQHHDDAITSIDGQRMPKNTFPDL